MMSQQVSLRRLVFLVHVLYVRLRMVMAAAIVFMIVAGWNRLGEQWDKLIAWNRGSAEDIDVVAADTEFFCPMCPGVLSTWPEKCPVCKMPLVRRSRMEATVLPDGVIARMQLTPYRVQLAGIRTSEIGYRALRHKMRFVGSIRKSDVETRDGKSNLQIVVPSAERMRSCLGRQVNIELASERGNFLHGRLHSLSSLADGAATAIANIECDFPVPVLDEGQVVELHFERLFAELEPYLSQPRNPPDRGTMDIRKVYYSERSAQRLFVNPGKSPFQDGDLIERKLRDNERLLWWTPIEPDVAPCIRSLLEEKYSEQWLCPTVITYLPAGEVLAIPDSAVIESGTSQIVFLETMPGMFDGVRVELGPLAEGYRPVIRGLRVGQRVVTNGAFLLDAETRLNPALAASYFGSGIRGVTSATVRGISAGSLSDIDAPDLSNLKQLTPQERLFAAWQRICPVTQAPLGSMGELVRVEFQGQLLFLCCGACSDQIPGGKVVEYSETHVPDPMETSGAIDR